MIIDTRILSRGRGYQEKIWVPTKQAMEVFRGGHRRALGEGLISLTRVHI